MAKTALPCFPKLNMKPFLLRWLITTLAVMVVTQLSFVGVRADSISTLIVAGLFLGVMNAVVRPLILLLSLPLLLLTMGLFFFVINAFMLWLAGVMIEGFHVAGFGSALFGSILISIVSWIFSILIGGVGDGGQRSGGGIRIIRVPSAPPPRAESSGGGGMKTVQGRVIEPEDQQRLP